MNTSRITAIIFPCLLATACGTKYANTPAQSPTVNRPTTDVRVLDPLPRQQPIEQPGIEQPVEIAPTIATPVEQAAQSLPAAVALRDQAAIATSASDHPRAIGLLERALRISPNDPQTYHDLASNHLAMQQPQQALQLARRGLTLNPTNTQRDALQSLINRSEALL